MITSTERIEKSSRRPIELCYAFRDGPRWFWLKPGQRRDGLSQFYYTEKKASDAWRYDRIGWVTTAVD